MSMTAWWQNCPPDEIITHFIDTLDAPQFPSAGVYMHLPHEASLKSVSRVVQSAEVATKDLLWQLRFPADRPYQWHHLRMSKEELAKNPRIYASVIQKLIQLGVVQDIKANQGF